ncbi:MAG: hypothetical protein KDD47_09525 [Acidobacteria bacterium]|nr:hypothetical protein [Acidobacteriota bacterium]
MVDSCRTAQRALFLSMIFLALGSFSAFGQGETVQGDEGCRIRGVERGEVYSRPVTLELEASLNRPGAQIFVNGQAAGSRIRIEEEGDYTVEVRSVGPLLAPEPSSRRCPPTTFSVDTTPPRVAFSRPDWIPPGAIPRVEVEDAYLAAEGVKVLLDGEPRDPGAAVGLGEHVLEVVAEDRAGNVTVARERFEQTALACKPESWLEYRTPTTLLSAVHYFPWYPGSGECSYVAPPPPPAPQEPTPSPAGQWCGCIWHPKGGLRPARGFYDSGSPAVVQAQLDQMIAHGIDVVSIEWTGNPSVTSNIVNVVIPAIASRNLKFVLLYDSSIRLAAGNPPVNLNNSVTRSKLIGDFQAFASSASYFKHPKYLKFGNEPVIYVFITRAYTGSTANLTNTFDALRQAAIDNGFSGLYLVADHLFWDTPDWNLMRLTHPRAMTSFAPVNPDQGVPQGSSGRPIRTWANKMATLYQNSRNAQTVSDPLVDLTPGVFIQWNNIGLDTDLNPFCNWDGPQYGWNLVDGTDWTYMLQTAGLNQARVAEIHLLKPNCGETVIRNPSNGTSIVWTYSYNEWYEGSGVEELTSRMPAYPYGFGLQPLQLLKQKLP